MLGHTRKHRTESQSSSKESSKNERSIHWRDAAKEVFGEEPSGSINLRGLRNREGITQAELGEALGIGQSNVSKLERGKRLISSKIAKRLQELFAIDYRLFL